MFISVKDKNNKAIKVPECVAASLLRLAALNALARRGAVEAVFATVSTSFCP